jgi:hypothetical protein
MKQDIRESRWDAPIPSLSGQRVFLPPSSEKLQQMAVSLTFLPQKRADIRHYAAQVNDWNSDVGFPDAPLAGKDCSAPPLA